jgi:putative oxidoreductase
MIHKISEDYGDVLYVIFRGLIGVMFFMHGWGKIFAAQPAEMFSLFWFAGIIELVVGLTVTIGLFTQWTALLGALQMLVAYFMVHMPQGWNPLENKGELALLYFAAFLVLIGHGGRRFCITKD